MPITKATNNVFAPSTGLTRWYTLSAGSLSKQAQVGDRINADTASGAFTITLPTSAQLNDQVIIRDPRTDPGNITANFFGWRTNNLTVSAQQRINGYNDTLVCNVQGATVTLTYWTSAIGWRLYVNE